MGATKLACLDLDSAASMYDQHTNPHQDKLKLKKAIWSCTYVNYKVKTASNRVEKKLPSHRMWRHPSKSWRSWNQPCHCSWLIMHFQSPVEIHEADPGDFCYRSWAYNSQQTAFDVSDIDLETTAGFHLLKEVKIWKGIPTASTYLNSAPLHPNQKPPPKLLTNIRTTQCTHLVQTTNPLLSYLQRSEQHNAHINISQTKNPVRSYLQRSEERSAHITVSLVEAPTIEYYYYYYSIVQDARLHNVTMLVVANDFDDELFI